METRTKCFFIIAIAVFGPAGTLDGFRRTVAKESGGPKANGEALADAGEGASVSGTVTLEGPKGAPNRVNMAADPACLKLHSAPVISDQVVIGANGGLATFRRKYRASW
jgi:hypothetical protein